MAVMLALYHLIAFSVDFYSVWYDLMYIELGRKGMGGKFKFLTKWHIVSCTITLRINIMENITFFV